MVTIWTDRVYQKLTNVQIVLTRSLYVCSALQIWGLLLYLLQTSYLFLIILIV